MVKLSILVISLTERRKMLEELSRLLSFQASMFDDSVEVLVEEDSGQKTSGAKRNLLVRKSRGAYFAFVDDDDWVSLDYVSTLYEAIKLDRHVISFDVMYTAPGGRQAIQALSIFHKDRQRLDSGKVGMRANHLCAWRRDIGTLVPFPDELGYNDDVFWYDPLIASGRVRSECRIARVLYHYKYSPVITKNQQPFQIAHAREWARGGVPCWEIDGRLYVATKGQAHTCGRDTVEARDGDGNTRIFRREELPEPYFVAKAK